MSKKYYQVEFYHIEGVWAENEDEAYDKARQKTNIPIGSLSTALFNYDDCVTEAPDCEDWEDPDAPEEES